MSIQTAEKLLQQVRDAVKVPAFRNAYEAQNAYETCAACLSTIRASLTSFSGERITALLGEADALEKVLQEKVFRAVGSATGSGGFSLDAFDDVGGSEEAENEASSVTAMMEREDAARKRQKKLKDAKNKKGTGDAKPKKRDDARAAASAKGGVESPMTGQKDVAKSTVGGVAVAPEVAESPVARVAPRVVATLTGMRGEDIPHAALADGGCCVPVDGTPLAVLQFAALVSYEGRLCTCHVTLHRALICALSSEVPAPHDGRGIPAAPAVEAMAEAVQELWEGVDDEAELELHSEDDAHVDGRGAGKDRQHGDGTGVCTLDELSRQLVAEYDAARDEEADGDNDGTRVLPRHLLTALLQRIRRFDTCGWVILMCHGGCFAGAVYENGRPIVHRAFHRYVVRKKQGGKQSSNDKESGSYRSAGSQIRQGQELKWKLGVRTTLLEWKAHIDAADIILYVAPGPQNRSILADFSQLPTGLTGGQRLPSPVDFKDHRVRKVPLTTHRPTFQEIQRIYDVLAHCDISIVEANVPPQPLTTA